jgi:hypothetical protein
MGNFIPQTEAVRKRKATGYPTGVDEESSRQIPWLLSRIEELENALIPFGKAFIVNQQFPRQLVEVYLKDCARAWEVLDSHQGTAIVEDNFFENMAE